MWNHLTLLKMTNAFAFVCVYGWVTWFITLLQRQEEANDQVTHRMTAWL